MTHPNERDRDVARYSVYLTLIGSIKRDLETGARGPDGRPRDPELLKKHLAILEGNLPQVREKAQQAGGTNPTVLEAMFAEAANAGDWNRAEEVAANAERGGNLPFATYLRARSLSVQGKHQAAAELIEGYRAQQPGHRGPDAAAGRGPGEPRPGGRGAAGVPRRLRPPPDRHRHHPGVRHPAPAERRGGQALDLYRQAARVAPGDAKIVSAWLSMESAIGDKAEALAWRAPDLPPESVGSRQRAPPGGPPHGGLRGAPVHRGRTGQAALHGCGVGGDAAGRGSRRRSPRC